MRGGLTVQYGDIVISPQRPTTLGRGLFRDAPQPPIGSEVVGKRPEKTVLDYALHSTGNGTLAQKRKQPSKRPPKSRPQLEGDATAAAQTDKAPKKSPAQGTGKHCSRGPLDHPPPPRKASEVAPTVDDDRVHEVDHPWLPSFADQERKEMQEKEKAMYKPTQGEDVVEPSKLLLKRRQSEQGGTPRKRKTTDSKGRAIDRLDPRDRAKLLELLAEANAAEAAKSGQPSFPRRQKVRKEPTNGTTKANDRTPAEPVKTISVPASSGEHGGGGTSPSSAVPSSGYVKGPVTTSPTAAPAGSSPAHQAAAMPSVVQRSAPDPTTRHAISSQTAGTKRRRSSEDEGPDDRATKQNMTARASQTGYPQPVPQQPEPNRAQKQPRMNSANANPVYTPASEQYNTQSGSSMISSMGTHTNDHNYGRGSNASTTPQVRHAPPAQMGGRINDHYSGPVNDPSSTPQVRYAPQAQMMPPQPPQQHASRQYPNGTPNTPARSPALTQESGNYAETLQRYESRYHGMFMQQQMIGPLPQQRLMTTFDGNRGPSQTTQQVAQVPQRPEMTASPLPQRPMSSLNGNQMPSQTSKLYVQTPQRPEVVGPFPQQRPLSPCNENRAPSQTPQQYTLAPQRPEVVGPSPQQRPISSFNGNRASSQTPQQYTLAPQRPGPMQPNQQQRPPPQPMPMQRSVSNQSVPQIQGYLYPPGYEVPNTQQPTPYSPAMQRNQQWESNVNHMTMPTPRPAMQQQQQQAPPYQPPQCTTADDPMGLLLQHSQSCDCGCERCGMARARLFQMAVEGRF
ncbi:Hypothetical predicted protein [Lecanosticta acicola]|uniref:Uncharacterized protein n=1 Tax=Lecanosticta acicola TaxID=111012 RepID=A0AAI8YYE7_9PEZI|nr:Hypothetical predicted protein [Lecanosticta acicola]